MVLLSSFACLEGEKLNKARLKGLADVPDINTIHDFDNDINIYEKKIIIESITLNKHGLSIILSKSAGVVAISASDRFGLLKKEESCRDGVANHWTCLARMEKQSPEKSTNQLRFTLW